MSAVERIRRTHPHPSAGVLTLSDAQLVIAREHGIESWPKFVKTVDAASGRLSPRSVWRCAERAVVDGDVPALEQLLHEYGDVLRNWRPRKWWKNPLPPSYHLGDAREIIVAAHGFGSWLEYEALVTELAVPGSSVALFEQAADALVRGQIDRLRELLAPHTTPDNCASVLASARHQSKREIERLVVTLSPRQAVASLVRKLPEARHAATGVAPGTQAASRVPSVAAAPTPMIAPLPAAAPAPPRPTIFALVPERYKV